jgi:hypothetical protein
MLREAPPARSRGRLIRFSPSHSNRQLQVSSFVGTRNDTGIRVRDVCSRVAEVLRVEEIEDLGPQIQACGREAQTSRDD